MYEVIETGVLVIGSGGAGCRAAIEAHDQGVDVLMITKGRLGHSGCTLNVGTSAAVGPWGDEEDSPMSMMRDLVAYGGFLGNQELALVLAEESTGEVTRLMEWGIDFERNGDGSIAINQASRHTYARNFAFKPPSPSRHDYGYPPGIAMTDVLMDEMSKRAIRCLDDFLLVDLLKTDGRIVGATCLDCVANRLVVFKARSVVLATGSFSQIYPATTVSPHETGDGQAAAYRSGAELIDMENTQFVPTTVGYPPGSIFLNARGELFLERYGIHTLVGVTKEEMCYAVWKEIQEGRGTDRGGILIDMRGAYREGPAGAMIMSNLEESLRQRGSAYFGFEGQSVDMMKPFETFPLAHTTTGGVRINTRCESSLPGLYAAGAVAGGVYGHARPEGYTSMITLVFGRRAGLFAARGAREADEPCLDGEAVQASLDRATELIETSAGAKAAVEVAQIRAVMREHAWVIKDEEGMRAGLDEIREIQEIQRMRALHSTFKARPKDGFEWAAWIEVPNLLLVSELMLVGGIERRESRGAFFRDDYPETDNERWSKNIIYRQVEGETVLEAVPVDMKYCGPEAEPAVKAL